MSVNNSTSSSLRGLLYLVGASYFCKSIFKASSVAYSKNKKPIVLKLVFTCYNRIAYNPKIIYTTRSAQLKSIESCDWMEKAIKVMPIVPYTREKLRLSHRKKLPNILSPVILAA